MLNPHSDVRLSKCPKCQRLTDLRKFALFIHIEGWGPMALGKTCRYCARCDLIMVQRDELEEQVAHAVEEIAPEVVRNGYMVLGTIEKKLWRAGLSGRGQTLGEMLKHVADFERQYHLEHEPGGWYPIDQRPRK